MKQAPIWAAIKAAIVQPCLTEFKFEDTASNPCRSGFLSKLWVALSAVLCIQLIAAVCYAHACDVHNQCSACFCMEK